MDHRRQRRPDEEREGALRRAPRPAASQGADTDAIIDLQASAGNQAVTALLAAPGAEPAAPTTPAVQRDRKDPVPADEDQAARGPRMAIPELKLDLPIQSFQRQVRGPTSREQAGESEMTVILTPGEADARLMRAAGEGRSFAVVTIVAGGMTMTLKGVVISSAQVGRPKPCSSAPARRQCAATPPRRLPVWSAF